MMLKESKQIKDKEELKQAAIAKTMRGKVQKIDKDSQHRL